MPLDEAMTGEHYFEDYVLLIMTLEHLARTLCLESMIIYSK